MQKKGQVWIETVTYTLVAFVLIGLVLAFAKPKIEELQDQSVIEQSLTMLKQIDSVVQEINEKGIGNKRKIEINLRKGSLTINPINNSILYRLEGKFEYSEPCIEGQLCKPYEESNIEVLTKQVGKEYHVTLERKYTDFNISFMNSQEIKSLLKATTPYTLYVSNKGGEKPLINFDVD